MKVTYQSKNYAPEKILRRYVRRGVDGEYWFCEVGQDRRYDLRQGTVEATEIAEDVRKKADELKGQYFGYVEWPRR